MRTSLDFVVADTHNNKTIGLVDTSMYNPDTRVDEPSLEVLLPGFSNYVKFDFIPNQVNIINSNSLRLTKAKKKEDLIDLPDGFYKIVYSICPKETLNVQRSFMRTNLIQCKLDRAFLQVDYNGGKFKERMEKLNEIGFLIQMSVSNANLCNQAEANRLYQIADRKLDILINQIC